MRTGAPDMAEFHIVIARCESAFRDAVARYGQIKRIVFRYHVFDEGAYSYTEPVSGLQRILGVKPKVTKSSKFRSEALWFYCDLGDSMEVAISIPYSYPSTEPYIFYWIDEVLKLKGLIDDACELNDIKWAYKYRTIAEKADSA